MNPFIVFIRGLLTGMLLQLAIGPVFIFIVNISMQSGLRSGIAAAAAVTLADYIYIALAILGIGKLIVVEGRKRFLTFISSLVLIIFGLMMIRRGFVSVFTNIPATGYEYSAGRGFIDAFILTISSPLTIVFWSGVFTAKGEEYSLSSRGLVLFGISAGLATPVFLGSAVLFFSMTRMLVPPAAISILNLLVGVLLGFYGFFRMKFFFEKAGEIISE